MARGKRPPRKRTAAELIMEVADNPDATIEDMEVAYMRGSLVLLGRLIDSPDSKLLNVKDVAPLMQARAARPDTGALDKKIAELKAFLMGEGDEGEG